MYVFAILLFFGLGVSAAVAFLGRPLLRFPADLWGPVAAGVGVALAWLADFDMWELWGIPVREEWIGITLTGLAIGGVAYVFHEVVGLLAGLHRKYEDEAVHLEMVDGIRRVA